MTEFEKADETLRTLGLTGTVRPGQFFVKTQRVFNGSEGTPEYWVCYTTNPMKAKNDLESFLEDNELADTAGAQFVLNTIGKLAEAA